MARENDYTLHPLLTLGAGTSTVVKAIGPSRFVVLRLTGSDLYVHFLSRSGTAFNEDYVTSISGVTSISRMGILSWDGDSGVIQYNVSGTLYLRGFKWGDTLSPAVSVGPSTGPWICHSPNGSLGVTGVFSTGVDNYLKAVERVGKSLALTTNGSIYAGGDYGYQASRGVNVTLDDVLWASQEVTTIVGSDPQRVNVNYARLSGTTWSRDDVEFIKLEDIGSGGINYADGIDITKLNPSLLVVLYTSTPDGAAPGDNVNLSSYAIQFDKDTGIVKSGNSSIINGGSSVKNGTWAKGRIIGYQGTKYYAVLAKQIVPSQTGFLILYEGHADASIAQLQNDQVVLSNIVADSFDSGEFTNLLSGVAIVSGGQVYVGVIERIPPEGAAGVIEALRIPRKRYPAWLGNLKLEELWR